MEEAFEVVDRPSDAELRSQDGVTHVVGIHYRDVQGIVSNDLDGNIEREQLDEGIVQPRSLQHVEDVSMPHVENFPGEVSDEARHIWNLDLED